MTSLSQDIVSAINHCLRYGIPFVCYRQPDCDVVFYADDNTSEPLNGNVFEIRPWRKENYPPVIIRCRIELEGVNALGKCRTQDTVLPQSTEYTDYINDITSLINTLKKRGGKAVISRVITRHVPNADWGRIAERLFSKFPNAMCSIFFHPEVGAWLGATPEILIKGNISNKCYETMALAGTHKGDCDWDEKNICEQQMVTDFIAESLKPLSEDIHIANTENLQYGDIQHICTRISGKLKADYNFDDTISKLSPTPAVAGLPREVAFAEIKSIERHSRGVYAGTVTVRSDNDIASYVYLRCAQIAPDACTIYAGGGITAQSNPDDEWNETLAKASPLLSVIQ